MTLPTPGTLQFQPMPGGGWVLGEGGGMLVVSHDSALAFARAVIDDLMRQVRGEDEAQHPTQTALEPSPAGFAGVVGMQVAGEGGKPPTPRKNDARALFPNGHSGG